MGPLIAVAVIAAVVLSGCGGDGQALAREACRHVDASLRLYAAAGRTTDRQKAAADRNKAIVQLEAALPLAAKANSADPQWNPLMTTLQEIGRNSEANLVSALRAQCEVANSSGTQPPIVGSTVPGEPRSPTPSTLPGQ